MENVTVWQHLAYLISSHAEMYRHGNAAAER